MEDSDKSVDLAELLRRVLEARLLDLHVALPGRVERYDAAQEVADVRPMLRRAIPSAETGEAVLETLPVIPSVPVCWPSGGGCAMTFPLAVGDPVELVFQDFDLDAYRRSGGDLSDPGVRSAHGLSGAVAIPCAVSGPVGADASHVKLAMAGGKQLHVGGSSDAAALASKLDALIDAVCTSAVFAGDGGATYQTNIKAALLSAGINTAGAADTGSARIKVDG